MARPVKKWYQSKTMWYNIAVSMVAAGNEMMPIVGVLDPAIADTVRAYLIVALAAGNTILRSITSTKVSL